MCGRRHYAVTQGIRLLFRLYRSGAAGVAPSSGPAGAGPELVSVDAMETNNLPEVELHPGWPTHPVRVAPSAIALCRLELERLLVDAVVEPDAHDAGWTTGFL